MWSIVTAGPATGAAVVMGVLQLGAGVGVVIDVGVEGLLPELIAATCTAPGVAIDEGIDGGTGGAGGGIITGNAALNI